MDITGYILTGGASSRMGADKARIELGGIRLAERAANALREVCADVYAVGSPVEGLELVPDDDHEGQAAVFGLEAALRHSPSDWTAILACDLPFITGDLFARLIELAANCDVSCNAVIPLQPDGRRQPLAGLYRTSICLAEVRNAIARGDRKLDIILDELSPLIVPFDRLRDLAGAAELFINVNTPEQLAAARRKVEAEA